MFISSFISLNIHNLSVICQNRRFGGVAGIWTRTSGDITRLFPALSSFFHGLDFNPQTQIESMFLPQVIKNVIVIESDVYEITYFCYSEGMF